MAYSKTQGHLALLAANIIFGLNTPIARSIIPGQIDPFALHFFRVLGAAILFWSASLFVKKEHMPLKDILLLLPAGLFAIVFNQLSFIFGLSLTSPIHASLVASMVPVVTMVLAAIIVREPLTWLKIAGVIIGASGALMLILPGGVSNGSSVLGDLFVFVSVTSFALYLTVFKNIVSKYSSVHTMKWMFLFSTIVSFPFCIKAFANVPYGALDASVYWRIAYVVCFATFISYFLIPIGQKTVRPTTLSMYNYLQPVVTSLVAVFWGMDVLGWKNVVAAVLVFSGVYLVSLSKARPPLDAEKIQEEAAGREIL